MKPSEVLRSSRSFHATRYPRQSCNTSLAHVYLPGADSSTIAVVGVSSKGAATILKIAQTVKGAHCATVDDRDQVYVCDPAHGKILVFKDSLSGLSSD